MSDEENDDDRRKVSEEDDDNDNQDKPDNIKKRKLVSSDNESDNDNENENDSKDKHVKKLPKSWREGDWMCPGCNEHLYAYKQVCSRCKTVRPDKDGRKKLPSSWREGDWFCPGCGNHKYAFKLYCECGQPKPSDLVRRNDRDSRGYDNGPRSYDRGSRGYDNGPRGYDRGSRGYDNGPRGYDNGPRGYDDGSRSYDRDHGAGKPGDWRCPTVTCSNNRGNLCFGSRPFCKKCGAARPENDVDSFRNNAIVPVGPSQSVITLVDRALLLSAKVPTFDVQYSVDNSVVGGLFNLIPMNANHAHSLIYPVYEALHAAFLENPSYLLAQLESKANPFKNDLASLATRRLNWDSKMNNLSVTISNVATNSRERFLHGERHKEIAHLTPYPICPEVTKQQGRRWPDFYRGHCETSTSILAFKTSETRAIIALHILPSIAELDPVDLYYFQLPLAYISF